MNIQKRAKIFNFYEISSKNAKISIILCICKKIYNCKTLLGVAGAIYRTEKHNGVYKCTYCHYRDTYQGDSLLWDDIKICGVNEEDDYDV